MRKPTLLALPILLMLQTATALAGRQDFTLENRTGYPIDQVYLSRNTARWGGDVTGADTLDDGHAMRISFSAPATACQWNLRVRYDDGGEATWSGLNLCNIHKVKLFWDRDREMTRALTE